TTNMDTSYLYRYSNWEASVSAGVHLPHTAVITELQASVEDNSMDHGDSASFAIDLWKLTPGNLPTSIASASTSGSVGGVQTPSDPTVNHQVDNQNNTYLVTAAWRAPSYPNQAQLKLYSVRIKYTVTSPLP
ncbi:unnamed protein product, partial [marine sediment metagenome]